MVSYFLGMTFCKLFADKLLHTPWVFHLDLLRSELKAVTERAISSGSHRPKGWIEPVAWVRMQRA